MLLQSADFDTSALNTMQSPPSSLISRLVSSAASRLQSTAITRAPSLVKRMAVAFPFPIPGPIEPAPVTIAIFPATRFPTSLSSPFYEFRFDIEYALGV
jgi:hypothetical protein